MTHSHSIRYWRASLAHWGELDAIARAQLAQANRSKRPSARDDALRTLNDVGRSRYAAARALHHELRLAGLTRT